MDTTLELLDYQSKSEQPRKWTVHVVGSNINPQKFQFQVATGFKYESPTKEDIEIGLSGKKLPVGEKWNIVGEGFLRGSLIHDPLSAKLEAEVSDLLFKGKLSPDRKFPPGHYNFVLKHKNKPVLHSSGEVKPDHVFTNTLELNLPIEGSHSYKWETLFDGNLLDAEDNGVPIKFTTTNAVYWDQNKFVKSSITIVKDDKLEGMVTWESHETSVRTLAFRGAIDKKVGGALSVTMEYEGKKASISVRVSGTANPITFVIDGNLPEHGLYHLEFFHQEVGEVTETKISASVNEKKASFTSKIARSSISPLIDIVLQLPQGTYSYYAKATKKGPNQALVEWKIKLGQDHFDLDGEYNVDSLEDFYVKFNIDSPKLGFDKLEFEAANKQAKSADSNTITFHGKNAGKEFTGSLSIVSKGTTGNIHYEGNGDLKVGDKAHDFKFLLKSSEENVNKHYLFEGSFDKHTLSAQTTIERDGEKSVVVKSSTKYCDQENVCKTNEYNAHYKRDGLNRDYTSELKLTFLLNPFANDLEHPLILKNHLKAEGLFYDRGISLEYGPKKLQYHQYFNKENTGFELELPMRTIAAELVHQFKTDNPVKSKIEASFWLDKKNHADEKTCLLLGSETTKLPHGHTVNSVASFHTPGLKELALKSEVSVNTKDHYVAGKLEADVFAKKNQKLVVDYKTTAKKDKEIYTIIGNIHVHSKGLNIDAAAEAKHVYETKTSYSYTFNGYYVNAKQAKREAVFKFSGDRKSSYVLAKVPEGVIFLIDESFTLAKDSYHAKRKYEILGLKIDRESSLKNNQLVDSYRQEDGTSYEFIASWDSGQVVELHYKFNGKPLANIEVALDDAHFLKPKYNYNTDTFKALVKKVKDHHIAVIKEGSRIFKESSAAVANEITDRSEEFRKAIVNLKPAVHHYQKKLDDLKADLKSVQLIEKAFDDFHSTFGTLFKEIVVIIQEITNSADRLITILNEAFKKANESVKELIPKLKKHYEEAFEILVTQYKAFLDFATTIIDSVLDQIKAHEKEIDELTSIITDFLRDVSEVVTKTVGAIKKEVKEFIDVFIGQLETQAIYQQFKEKLQELQNFQIPEQYWEMYHEVVSTIEPVLPTPELRNLFKTLAEVFEMILKKQPFDKSEIAQTVYNDFHASVQSIVAIIEAHRPGGDSPKLPSNVLLPLPSYSLLLAPPGTFRFSLFKWLRSSDLPTLADIIHTYRPQHSPLDIIPPFTATALLMGGTEFLTFDKKHYSFKGSCSYLLTKDIIDGNFTIIANVEAGKLKSIALFDHENSLEILHDNKVLVNGKPAEFPVQAGDLVAWKKFDLGIGLATYSGFVGFCTPHLDICAFSIDGYYFGKTRGLLGTYNYEPYDDAINPSGIIAKSSLEFANSWKVTPSCPDVAVPDQPAPPAEECTKLFAADSSLRNCFPFQNPEAFREACNKQVAGASAEAKQEKACNIALSYVGYCHYVHLVLGVKLPDHCGKCKVGSQSLQIGESTSVKTPQNAADIIFVVEQLHDNEEVFKNLITPLVPTLTKDLREKGITDVKFALIGYGAPEQDWPAIYTFNGEYDGFTGTAKNIYFPKVEKVTDPKFSHKIQHFLELVAVETGTTKAAKAFKEAFKYPFRPEAVRTIIGVNTLGSCVKAYLPFQQASSLVYQIRAMLADIKMNLITPLEDLKVEGKDEKSAANIVGFDQYYVYTQGEAKRKALKGDSELWKHLEYTRDPCIDYTLQSEGAVFSSNNFIKGKPNLRKNFLQVLSTKIAEDLTREELTKSCKCVLEKGMAVRTSCTVGLAGKLESEVPAAKGVKGVKG